MTYNELKANLQSAGNSTRCKDLKKWLEATGFTVTRKGGNHHTVTHTGLPSFHASGYDCGHGKNPQVNMPYIKKMLKLVKLHEDDLREYLGETI